MTGDAEAENVPVADSPAADMPTADPLTVEVLRDRLRRAHVELGLEGRFSVTFYQPEPGECSILHWTRSGNEAFENCREVGHGSVEDCLAALDRYVADRKAGAAPAD